MGEGAGREGCTASHVSTNSERIRTRVLACLHDATTAYAACAHTPGGEGGILLHLHSRAYGSYHNCHNR